MASCSSDDESKTQTAKGTPVKVAVTQTLDCLPLYVARELGIDSELGIAIMFQEHASKCDLDSALLNGSVQAVFTDFVRGDRLKARRDSFAVYPHDNTQLYFFTNSKSRLTEAKQLTDKVIGVDRQGADAVMMQALLDSVKLADEKAFLVQMQNYGSRQKMLLLNTLDAVVLPEPYATHARKAGHRDIHSVKTLRGRSIGCMVARGKTDLLRQAYNRACDSINRNGIHRYDSVIVKHYDIPQQFVKDIPAHRFSKL